MLTFLKWLEVFNNKVTADTVRKYGRAWSHSYDAQTKWRWNRLKDLDPFWQRVVTANLKGANLIDYYDYGVGQIYRLIKNKDGSYQAQRITNPDRSQDAFNNQTTTNFRRINWEALPEDEMPWHWQRVVKGERVDPQHYQLDYEGGGEDNYRYAFDTAFPEKPIGNKDTEVKRFVSGLLNKEDVDETDMRIFSDLLEERGYDEAAKMVRKHIDSVKELGERWMSVPDSDDPRVGTHRKGEIPAEQTRMHKLFLKHLMEIHGVRMK